MSSTVHVWEKEWPVQSCLCVNFNIKEWWIKKKNIFNLNFSFKCVDYDVIFGCSFIWTHFYSLVICFEGFGSLFFFFVHENSFHGIGPLWNKLKNQQQQKGKEILFLRFEAYKLNYICSYAFNFFFRYSFFP